jgi:hypothetical protein
MGHDMPEVRHETGAEAPLDEPIGGLGQLRAAIFEKGHGAPQRAHECFPHVGDALARPRLRHRHGERVDMVKRRGRGVQLVMARLQGQHGPYLARA